MKPDTLSQPAASLNLAQRSLQLVGQYIEQTLFLMLLPALLILLGQMLFGNINQLHHWSDVGQRQQLGLLCFMVGGVWSLLNIGPALYFRIHAVAGESVSVGTSYKQGLPFLWRLISYYFVVAVVLIAGFIAFIIPGIVLLFLYINRYYLTQYYIVDKDLRVSEAMRICRLESTPYKNAIWGIVGIQILGSVIVGVLGVLGVIGTLAGEVVNASLFFLAALRYREIILLSAASVPKVADKK